MKTFAQLKRDLQVGKIVKTILNIHKPERTGQDRKIGKTQSNAIAFEIPQEEQKRNWRGELMTLSWLWLDLPANYYEYDGNTFKVYAPKKINRIFVNGKEKKEYIGKELEFIYEILN